MSTIQSSSVLLGRRSALMRGSARFSTVRSIDTRNVGSPSTARPSHSRRVAPASVCSVMTIATSRRDLERTPFVHVYQRTEFVATSRLTPCPADAPLPTDVRR